MQRADKISIKLDPETNQTLERLSSKKNISKSELIRIFIKQGLEKDLAKESIDFIRDNIHDEINNICKPQFERLAKLNAKIGYQSVSTFYLLAYIIDSIIPVQKQKDFEEIKKVSKMMAISYLKSNESEFNEFMKSEDKALEFFNLNKKDDKKG